MPLLAVASNRTSSAISFSHCCSASVGFLIDAKLMIYATNGSGDVKRLKGTRGCRLRIGDWRVIFIDNESGEDARFRKKRK
jgi:hypothetical protein